MLHHHLIKGDKALNQSVSILPSCDFCDNKDCYILLCFLYFIEQIEDSNFSLNHPNQYFIESQRLLGGGKDIKREMDVPQRSQENSAARGSGATREAAAAANASQGLAENTEDLDSYFQDA